MHTQLLLETVSCAKEQLDYISIWMCMLKLEENGCFLSAKRGVSEEPLLSYFLRVQTHVDIRDDI